MSSAIEVTGGGCLFDIGGRVLQIQKTFQMNGQAFIKIMNAGDVTVTATGKLKARGDFVTQSGFIVQGGLITIDSSGTITLVNCAVIDVSGDGSGEVDLTSQGDLTVQNGATLIGNGITSFTDTGDRFADGGTVSLTSLGGNVFSNGAITVSGDNQATGGEVDFQSARDTQINQQIDATGGGSDGGDLEIDAGDSVSITKTIDVSSRVGGGFGGSMSISAGEDSLGGITPGGSVTININTAVMKLNGSDAETSGGDGGDFEADAAGNIQIIGGTGTAIQATGGSVFDGSGGTIFFDSGDDNPNTIGPLDGSLTISGAIIMQSGGAGGDGGDFDFSAGPLVRPGDRLEGRRHAADQVGVPRQGEQAAAPQRHQQGDDRQQVEDRAGARHGRAEGGDRHVYARARPGAAHGDARAERPGAAPGRRPGHRSMRRGRVRRGAGIAGLRLQRRADERRQAELQVTASAGSASAGPAVRRG
jgi:hypothetical protein